MKDNPYLPDDVELEESTTGPQAGAANRPGCFSANVITLLFLGLTALFVCYFAVLMANPYLPLNPFPPRTPLPVYVVATADPGSGAALVPTKVPETPHLNTVVPTLTPTVTPTATLPAQDTPVVVTPPGLASVTAAPPTPTLVGGGSSGNTVEGVYTPPAPVDPELVTRSPFPFTVEREQAATIENPNDQGCRWASIAGSAVNLEGLPVTGLAVHVVGEGIDEIRFTGTALTFGSGGYEVFLNGAPLQGQYVVQLLSQTGAPISDEFPVQTSPVCEENVTIVNFVQNHEF